MNNDFFASIIVFIGAFYLYFFRLNKIDIMSKGSNALLLPRIILIILMILSFLLAVKQFFVKSKKKSNLSKDKNNFILLVTIILSILYLYGINILGFFILTPIFIFLFTYILDYKKHFLNIIFSLSLTTVVYILFIKILYVPLPQGIGIFKTINEYIMFL